MRVVLFFVLLLPSLINTLRSHPEHTSRDHSAHINMMAFNCLAASKVVQWAATSHCCVVPTRCVIASDNAGLGFPHSRNARLARSISCTKFRASWGEGNAAAPRSGIEGGSVSPEPEDGVRGIRSFGYRIGYLFRLVAGWLWAVVQSLLLVRIAWLLKTTATLKAALLDSKRQLSSSSPALGKGRLPTKGKAGMLSEFIAHLEDVRAHHLDRIDPLPEYATIRPAAAVAAASRIMGTSLEETFALLRQESEELQRLQAEAVARATGVAG